MYCFSPYFPFVALRLCSPWCQCVCTKTRIARPQYLLFLSTLLLASHHTPELLGQGPSLRALILGLALCLSLKKSDLSRKKSPISMSPSLFDRGSALFPTFTDPKHIVTFSFLQLFPRHFASLLVSGPLFLCKPMSLLVSGPLFLGKNYVTFAPMQLFHRKIMSLLVAGSLFQGHFLTQLSLLVARTISPILPIF